MPSCYLKSETSQWLLVEEQASRNLVIPVLIIKTIFTDLFYVYECFAQVYVCTPHGSLVSTELKEGIESSELEFHMVVCYYVGAL